MLFMAKTACEGWLLPIKECCLLGMLKISKMRKMEVYPKCVLTFRETPTVTTVYAIPSIKNQRKKNRLHLLEILNSPT